MFKSICLFALIVSSVSVFATAEMATTDEQETVIDAGLNQYTVRDIARRSMVIKVAGAFDADLAIRREIFIKNCMQNSRGYQIPGREISEVQIRLWCADSIDNLMSAQ